MRIGIIGLGYWGPNLVRNFAETPGSEVVAVSDLRPERRDLLMKTYHCEKSYDSLAKLVLDPRIDAVAVLPE